MRSLRDDRPLHRALGPGRQCDLWRIENGEVVLRATGRGSDQLRRDLGEIEAVFSFAEVLGVDPEGRIPEDRSLGRLVGLRKADVTAALRTAAERAPIPIITHPPDVARTRRHRRG